MVAMPPQILTAIPVSDFPAAFDLHGQHHGYADKIDRLVKIDGFEIFVDKIHLDALRQ